MEYYIKHNHVKEFIKKEIVLTVATLLAIASSFFVAPKIGYIDFKVLALLFNLMIVICAFKEIRLLDYIAISLLKKCTTYKNMSLALISLTFFSSMLVTNDVALLTFIPLTLIIGAKSKESVLKLVIFQTLAANLGSSLTPMGNPQNLYIYSFYKIPPMEFIKTMLPMLLISIVYLFTLNHVEPNRALSYDLETIVIEDKNSLFIFLLVFITILLSVFHILDYRIVLLLTIFIVLIRNKKLFLSVDYSLLFTFVGFFIFIGNISSMSTVKSFMSSILSSSLKTYIFGIVTSQFISNVPATILLSSFTTHFKELLLAVDVGGMGTLIASLASVISYKLYVSEYKEHTADYLKGFTFYNLIGLAIFIPLVYLLL